MSNFNLLKLSDRATYWYEVASYIAPYAKVGSFIVSGLTLISERSQEQRLAEISRKLDEIKTLINRTRAALEKKMNDIPVKDRTGEILGIEETLNEYRIHGRQGVLDNAVSESALTKGKIRAYIEASDTPLAYRGTYCALYTMLIPLRVAAFEMFDTEASEVNKLVAGELSDLIAISDIAIETSEKIGDRRVTAVQEERFLVDELGPVYGTNFYTSVDGDERTIGTFVPNAHNIAEVRRTAREVRDGFAAIKASEASAPFRTAFKSARTTLDTSR